MNFMVLFLQKKSSFSCWEILLITFIFVKNKEVRSNYAFVYNSRVIFNQFEGVVGLKFFDQISQFSFWRKMNPSRFDMRSMAEIRILRSSKYLHSVEPKNLLLFWFLQLFCTCSLLRFLENFVLFLWYPLQTMVIFSFARKFGHYLGSRHFSGCKYLKIWPLLRFLSLFGMQKFENLATI